MYSVIFCVRYDNVYERREKVKSSPKIYPTPVENHEGAHQA